MKALLVIDVQRNLVERKLFKKEAFISTVKTAIESFRKRKWPVIFIQHNNNFLVAGESGWKIDASMSARESDPVIQKDRGDAFEKTGLGELLRKKGVEGIVACGLVSHGCVRATCLGGLNQGFTVALLRGGHTNWAKDAAEWIEAVEEELSAAGVEIVSLADIR